MTRSLAVLGTGSIGSSIGADLTKAGSIIPKLGGMLDRYYELMGWDKATGKPLPETLRRLGLEHTIKDIWS